MFLIEFTKARYLMQGPIFTLILLFYNYFIITSLLNILEYQIDASLLYLVLILIALSRLISMEIERHKTNKLTQILTEINNFWLWASFMYLFEIIFFYIIGIFIELSHITKIALILLILVLGFIGYYIAHHNYIRGYELYLTEKTNANSKPVTIIHISDIHYGSMVRQNSLKRIVKSINKIASQNSNSKVITIISGDAADGSAPISEDTFLPFKDINVPVIFTPGNHDYYPGLASVKKALKKAGVIILDNDNLEYANENINIIGLSFSFSQEDQESYKLPIKEDMNNILIYHAPLYWEEFSKMGIELELSGHTHGGQFYPMTYFTGLMFKYNHGLFNKEIKKDNNRYNSYLSVTEGVGYFAVPIRLHTRSEIVVLNINRIKRE